MRQFSVVSDYRGEIINAQNYLNRNAGKSFIGMELVGLRIIQMEDSGGLVEAAIKVGMEKVQSTRLGVLI